MAEELDKKSLKDKDHEEKREWLSDLVKLVVLVWSASLLTASYSRLPNGQKIMDFDPTFIASVFSGSLAGFGIAAAKNNNMNNQKPGSSGQSTAPKTEYKKEEKEPEVKPVWNK